MHHLTIDALTQACVNQPTILIEGRSPRGTSSATFTGPTAIAQVVAYANALAPNLADDARLIVRTQSYAGVIRDRLHYTLTTGWTQ